MNDPKTIPCDRRIIDGRFRKADQFLEAAETIREFAGDETEIGDGYVTLCVHSGIAAADVICCVALGKHARGQDHLEAVALLGTVRPDGKRLGQALSALLGMKHRAGYGAEPVSADQRKRARRNAERFSESSETVARVCRQPESSSYHALDALREGASKEGVNLVPLIVDAARDYVTLGEMCDALRDVWGVWRETPVF